MLIWFDPWYCSWYNLIRPDMDSRSFKAFWFSAPIGVDSRLPCVDVTSVVEKAFGPAFGFLGLGQSLENDLFLFLNRSWLPKCGSFFRLRLAKCGEPKVIIINVLSFNGRTDANRFLRFFGFVISVDASWRDSWAAAFFNWFLLLKKIHMQRLSRNWCYILQRGSAICYLLQGGSAACYILQRRSFTCHSRSTSICFLDWSHWPCSSYLCHCRPRRGQRKIWSTPGR